MKRAATLDFGNLPTYFHHRQPYDPDKLGLGRLMIQKTGPNPEDRWAGPLPIAAARPLETSSSNAAQMPFAFRWSETADSQIDWVFFASAAVAGTSRRIIAYTFNRITGEFAYKGWISLTLPATGNQTVRAFRVVYEKYTKGTVSVSGGVVTGSGTTWVTDGICNGSRIGFGSVNPHEITQWYEINSIDEGTLSIAGSASVPAGTPYVIEDLRILILNTNATPANGGLYMAKGIHLDLFSDTGTVIGTAPAFDDERGVYWLKTTTTESFTAGFGMGVEPMVDWQTQFVWIATGSTNARFAKMNIRAPLTGISGSATTSALVLATSVSGSLVGTIASNNNGRFAVAQHGTGAGLPCFYFTTVSRIYRSKRLDWIVDGDMTHISGGDNMVPVPPGGPSTFGISAGFQNIEHADSIDRFVITNSTGGLGRPYLTQYGASTLDRVFTADLQNNLSSSADSDMPLVPRMSGNSGGVWLEDSLAYHLINSTTVDTNVCLAIPLLADWEYAQQTNCFIISPRIQLPDCDRVMTVTVQEALAVGGRTGANLAVQTEPFRTYYRTSGISDNSGAWTLLDDTGECNVSGVSEIQFRFEFRTLGPTCVPTRLFNVNVIYEDTNTDSRYQFSAGQSSAANKRFAWRHATAFGGAVPALRVRLYDAVTGNLLVDDNTASPTGTWERSTDGVNRVAWTNADKGNETTYVYYTPASIADNVQVRAVLTLA